MPTVASMSRRLSISQDGSVPEGSNPMQASKKVAAAIEDSAEGLTEALDDASPEVAAAADTNWRTKVMKLPLLLILMYFVIDVMLLGWEKETA